MCWTAREHRAPHAPRAAGVYRVMTAKPPFEHAVSRHGPTVLRVCRAALGAGPDAEDAWSETFLAALRRWPDLPADTNVEAWLVRVATRKTIDVARARARRAVPTDEVAGLDVSARGGGAGAAADPAEGDGDVWRVVAALPQRQREAIAYHYLGGLRHTETAELTGSTPAAVRRAAADALAALRRHPALDAWRDQPDGRLGAREGSPGPTTARGTR